MPADLWRFYTETGGARLEGHDALGRFVCSIYSPSNLHLTFDFESIDRELKHLAKQGLITPKYYAERIKSIKRSSSLRVFAEAHSYGNQTHFIYVCGDDPERFSDLPPKPSRATIFRWTGEPTSEAFEPVARTFSDWLEAMVERFSAKQT